MEKVGRPALKEELTGIVGNVFHATIDRDLRGKNYLFRPVAGGAVRG